MTFLELKPTHPVHTARMVPADIDFQLANLRDVHQTVDLPLSNPSMHATCLIRPFLLSVLRSTKPPIRPERIVKRQLCRIYSLPADECSRSAEANPYLSAPLTALCHRA